MEGDAGAQVAPPIFLHHPHPIRFHETLARKRDFPWQQNPNFPPSPNWNPNLWEWDSVGFSAKPAPTAGSDPIKAQALAKNSEDLTLKLGVVEATAGPARPSKRVRPGSPGGGPSCQVDDCGADLTAAKDYHRRHKVCEGHSKMSTVLVANQMQRFCQQCSRFHLLSEFDEGKRSCRRRLAGHNRRRRKTQPDDVSSKLQVPGTPNIVTNGSVDLVNLLAVLAKLQGTNAAKTSMPDRDRLLQVLAKINSLKESAPKTRGFDLNVAQEPQPCKANENHSTTDLLTILSAALTASAPDLLASLSQGSSYSSGDDKTKMPSAENSVEVRQTMPLQLFGSPEDDSPPKLASSVKYFSSESSNPMEDRSPSSSPPVVQKLFPLHSATEQKHDGWSMPLNLFKENGTGHSSPNQACYTSSVSDHSPSSSNSDAQDRTGRIIFKLFDKDPSKIPATLRTQIVNWLSHSPSEMESYIRPGCVVLSLYASMPSITWDELEEDLLERVDALVKCSDAEFWRNGRFLVRTYRQLASHKDGKVRLSKSWRTWSAPELISVSPIAVMSGKDTSLVLRGRNLTIPGTKIHCTYKGGYASKNVLGSAYPGTIYDDLSTESFDLPGFPNSFGRCFIEVENGFKGNSFPIIIADSTICQELRALETEFEYAFSEDALHFLNELGWLFQRYNIPTPSFVDFSCIRFKFLMTFSVERDWSFLVKMLLDLLVERSLTSDDLARESLEMLLEIQLLNRAVKRKCLKMVKLLLNYYVIRGEAADSASKMYIFPPNSVGPGGLTPLHLAASAEDAEDIVDALTNDPQEIGMNCWNSILDDTNQSPCAYASLRNNHSYNNLVARKVRDRTNGQISIDIASGDSRLKELSVEPSSCSQCVLKEKIGNKRILRSRGLLARPYVHVHAMLAIAAVCVCVCLFFRGSPEIGTIAPFKWENLDFGPK